jgi:hypothetical protein
LHDILVPVTAYSLCWAALTSPAVGQTPTTADVSAANVDLPRHRIPFELYGNRIYVQVSGPGFDRSLFLLDTGAGRTHYTAELVTQARLPTSGSIGITGAGPGRVAGRRVAATTLRIGSLTLPVSSGISGPAEPLFGNIYSGAGRAFQGVIGYDLFAAYVVRIDYEQRVLWLYDRGNFRGPRATAIPLRIVDRKPYFTAAIGAPGSAPIAANVHLDTGGGGVLGLNGRYVSQQRLLDRVGPTLPSAIQGVGGATQSRLARIETLQLGRFTLASPVVSLALAQGGGVRSDSAGWVGGAALRRFTVTIDYPRRSMWLEPNSSFGQPFNADMSGLTIYWTATPADTLHVSNVAEGSPGDVAGVRAGDRLLSINERPAALLGIDEIRELLRGDGERRKLRLLRDGRELELWLVLRRRL